MKAEAAPLLILGVPAPQLALSLAFSCLAASLFLLPAVADFGHSLLGKEDISLFIWIFSEYSHSLGAGTLPFHTDDIFYPYGISLSTTPTSPVEAILYLAMPPGWGEAGRITALQFLSYALGGVFSFALAYRFSRSFLPSLAGSVVYNLSVFHFEKAIHHLNYGMAIPMLALFFIFYFEGAGSRKKPVLALAASMLLLSLGEVLAAVMAGFIVFIDILLRYAKRSSVSLLRPRNMLILAFSAMLSLIASMVLYAAQAAPIFAYTVPSLFFIAPALFLVLGFRNLAESEKKMGLMRMMVIAAIPTLAYIALLVLLPSYQFRPDSILDNDELYSIPVEYLVIPSDFQALSHTGLFSGLGAFSEAGLYVGLMSLGMLALSAIIPKAGNDEAYFRDMSVLSILFAFPLIETGNEILMLNPFFAQPLFPLLPLLRVPSRFILFALLFLSVFMAIFIKRVLSGFPARTASLLCLLLIALLLAERWPASASFVFSPHVPSFYSSLAAAPGSVSVFLYPNFNYYEALEEMYYQTIHGQKLSYGIVSKPPYTGNPLYEYYDRTLNSHNVTANGAVAFALSEGYDYMTVQKTHCESNCFYGRSEPFPEKYLDALRTDISRKLGEPVFEDDRIMVFRLRKA